ncbi:hypothetical protein JCM9279_004159 [Rhodotorula babjevae]
MHARSIFSLAVLAGSALALSPADLTRLVAKRDLASDTAAAMEAATALGTAAVTAAGDGHDVAATLACACSDSFLSGMSACAACIGEDAPAQADTIRNTCTSAASSMSGSMSAGESATSAASAAESSAASGVSSIASSVSSGVSSVSSAISSAASEASESASASAPAASASGDSGASTKTLFGGAAVAAGAVAAAMLA